MSVTHIACVGLLLLLLLKLPDRCWLQLAWRSVPPSLDPSFS